MDCATFTTADPVPSPSNAARIVAIPAKADAARVGRIMAYLDRRSAKFEAVPGCPGWYAAHWEDYEEYSDPQCWACSTDVRKDDRPFALAFKERAERQMTAAA